MAGCLNPIGLSGVGLVPCGKCANCLSNSRNEWTYRLLHEYIGTVHHSYFITLTYADENLPLHVFPKTSGLTVCFNKNDVLSFLNRLRSFFNYKYSCKFRYFLVSEYGSHTFRPHYHALLFNIPEDVRTFRDTLLREWSLGRIQCDSISKGRIHYCTKYCLKEDEDFYREFDVVDTDNPEFVIRPFRLMSKGLGKSYITRQLDFHHPFDGEIRSFCLDFNNTKRSIPRYFREKIFDDFDKEIFRKSARIYRNSINSVQISPKLSISGISFPDTRKSDILKNRSSVIHHFKDKF